MIATFWDIDVVQFQLPSSRDNAQFNATKQKSIKRAFLSNFQNI